MPDSKKYRIYLSSTFRDLEKHRAEVIKFFNVVSERFELKNMEMYAPDGQKAVDACIRDVEECDIYLLLVGRRCGWIPGEDPADPASIAGDDAISITHLEFKTAEASKCTVLVFLSDPADPTLPQDPADALFDIKQEKLAALRAEANEYKHHASYFTSPDNLARQVSEAIILTKKEILLPQEHAKLIKPEHKLCCDRTPQFNEYWRNSHCNDFFKAYLIHGSRGELGGNFINRIGEFSLNFKINQADFQNILNSLTDPQKIRDHLLIELFRTTGAVSTGGRVPTPTDVLAAVEAAGQHYHAVRLVLEEADQWTAGFDILRTLLADFHAACQDFQRVRMVWFVQVNDIDVEQSVAVAARLSPLDSCFHVLPRLVSPRMFDVRTWLANYITNDEAKIELLAQSEPLAKLGTGSPLPMLQVEMGLGQFIKKFNAQDPDLLALLDF